MFEKEKNLNKIKSDSLDNIDLYKAIDELNPKLKTIIILRFFEDMKLEDIANITHTNVNTVKSRLYKALHLLKINLEDGI